MEDRKKLLTNILKIGIPAIILVILIISKYLDSHIRYSDSTEPGNTAGNLYNGGLFCESGNRIYFSNPMDDGTLYEMDLDLNVGRQLYPDNVRYINADENYLFYSRMNNLKENPANSIFVIYSNGIYRIKKNGKGLAMLHTKPVGSVLLYNNLLFYQNYTEGSELTLRFKNIEGENDRELAKNDAKYCSIYDGCLYYSGVKKDHYIHKLNISNADDTIVCEHKCFMPIAMESGIYFMDTENGYRIVKSNHQGEDIQLVVDKQVSTYNISSDERYIYYQVDGGSNNGLEVLDTQTGETKRIENGDYKWVHVTSGYCFFYSFDGNTVYAYSPEKGLKVLFNK